MSYTALKERAWKANMELRDGGLIVLTWGNASEIDRNTGAVAIKPSGVPYETLEPEHMVVVDVEDGTVIEGELRPSSDTATHLVLYRSFADIGGVVHTHSTFATSWAQAGRPIRCLGTTHADTFYGEVPVTRCLTREEIEEAYEESTGLVIAERFSGIDPMAVPAVLLPYHGPFTWGEDAHKAAVNAIILEEVAKMALYAEAIDKNMEPAPEYLLDKHYLRKHGPGAYYGQAKS
jgi:L-ribulose-5-phosphate 4-epimerase